MKIILSTLLLLGCTTKLQRKQLLKGAEKRRKEMKQQRKDEELRKSTILVHQVIKRGEFSGCKLDDTNWFARGEKTLVLNTPGKSLLFDRIRSVGGTIHYRERANFAYAPELEVLDAIEIPSEGLFVFGQRYDFGPAMCKGTPLEGSCEWNDRKLSVSKTTMMIKDNTFSMAGIESFPERKRGLASSNESGATIRVFNEMSAESDLQKGAVLIVGEGVQVYRGILSRPESCW